MDTTREPATDSLESDDVVGASYVDNAAALERYVHSMVRDPDEAADICQEVFVRLLVTGRAGRMPDVPMAWMRRVAYNLVVSRARRRQTRDRTIARLSDQDSYGSTEDTILRRERDGAIVDALASTAADGRTAMLLAAQGYRAGEIAERIGRTELATRTLLCRARGKLRLRLADMAGA